MTRQNERKTIDRRWMLNLRSELVWKTFMHDKEIVRAMEQAGFHRHDLKG
jgi:hypothetical protein